MAVNLWTPLSAQSGYAGVDALIVSYMGRKEIDVLGREPHWYEETPYRCGAIVKAFERFVQEDRACLDAGFPEEAITVFRDAGYSLWRVPVVPVANLIIALKVEDLQGLSVARYKAEGSLGYAFHVQGYIDDFNRETSWGRQIRSLEGVVEMFKNATPYWGISGNDTLIIRIEEAYDHLTAFPPLSEAARELGIRRPAEQYPFISRVLTGTDPILRLAREVPQVEQPLPEKPLK
jgi:hypothetical protein